MKNILEMIKECLRYAGYSNACIMLVLSKLKLAKQAIALADKTNKVCLAGEEFVARRQSHNYLAQGKVCVSVSQIHNGLCLRFRPHIYGIMDQSTKEFISTNAAEINLGDMDFIFAPVPEWVWVYGEDPYSCAKGMWLTRQEAKEQFSKFNITLMKALTEK